jgi:hypothetical protein
MSVLTRRRRITLATVAVASWAALSPAVELSEASRAAFRRTVRMTNDHEAQTVRHAVTLAGRRLAQEGCQRVLDDFTNATGQPLTHVLDAAGRTPERHLQTLFFYDGSDHPRCRREPRTLAFTSPGSHVVFVCVASFGRAPRGVAATVVIHEMLHTLGLGEDPPTSDQITTRVRDRCGS